MSQFDLFATASDDAPAARLAQPSIRNPGAYRIPTVLCTHPEAWNPCEFSWVTAEPIPDHVVHIGFASKPEGWRMTLGYHFPHHRSAVPVFLQTATYPARTDAVRAGLARIELSLSCLQLSFSISQDKAKRIREAIDNITQAAESGLSLFKDAAWKSPKSSRFTRKLPSC